MDQLDFFKNTFLFADIDLLSAKRICEILSAEVKCFSRSDIIYSPESYSPSIGFILEGECSVCRVRSNGASVSLNTLKQYDSFGITAVFSCKDTFPTQISAKKATKVVFLAQNNLLSAINEFPLLAINIIKFLTGRVEFLNNKIATLTSCGCDEKLASLLFSEYTKRGTEAFELNCKAAAESLGIGRASLYRGIKTLTDEGYIDYVDKKIYIKDPKGLKGISK